MERNDELMHYGVMGMKCGVRRGNVSEAYSKASAKRDKLNRNVSKTKTAYERATVKANTGVSAKYKKLQAKADKAQYKAEKWMRSMDKVFKNADLSSIQSSTKERGRNFVKNVS